MVGNHQTSILNWLFGFQAWIFLYIYIYPKISVKSHIISLLKIPPEIAKPGGELPFGATLKGTKVRPPPKQTKFTMKD